jgi:hypothetical protein
MLEKAALHFHDFDHINKTCLIIMFLRMVADTKRGIPVNHRTKGKGQFNLNFFYTYCCI